MVRMPPDEILSIDNWIKGRQSLKMSRPEAIRRLVKIALKDQQPQRQRSKKSADRAAELAADVIDKKIADAPAEERAIRKARILKGPSMIRSVRKN